jgi:hypothetical protein
MTDYDELLGQEVTPRLARAAALRSALYPGEPGRRPIPRTMRY